MIEQHLMDLLTDIAWYSTLGALTKTFASLPSYIHHHSLLAMITPFHHVAFTFASRKTRHAALTTC